MNHLGQPIGEPLPNWQPSQPPQKKVIAGQYCRLEPIDTANHAQQLFDANQKNVDGTMWTYLPYGPFDTLAQYRDWMNATCLGNDPLFFAIIDNITNRATGLAAYLRIDPKIGNIEVGHLAYSPALQRTPAATEAMYLMMKQAFDLGYRRYEWKCDALNAPSRSAAQRLGFSYEGLFRQATIVKGRNRDTAWFAIIDRDWPALRAAFEGWLSPNNFDGNGQQRESLSALTAPLLAARD
jgi:RimJ/RimL family protein N-acetyltransferase